MTSVCCVRDISIGPGQPLAVIAGPCVLESEQLGYEIGSRLRDVCSKLGLSYIFKASFDKANRSSIDSPRGPGMDEGLGWMACLRDRLGVPTTTDVHESSQCDQVAQHVDLLQIPAFLCRQTDLLLAAGEAVVKHSGVRGAVNVKKGQFVSPPEMAGPMRKLASVGCENILLTERGTFFGYGRLVNDFAGLTEMRELSIAHGGGGVCFDCTHSTQRPGGEVTGGSRELAPVLARAAVAAGVDAVFIECHPEPERALSDAATMMRLEDVPGLLAALARIRDAAITAD